MTEIVMSNIHSLRPRIRMNLKSQHDSCFLTDTRGINCVNRLRVSLHAFAQLNQHSQIHLESFSLRIKMNEQAVQDIMSCIEEFGWDPFDTTQPE